MRPRFWIRRSARSRAKPQPIRSAPCWAWPTGAGSWTCLTGSCAAMPPGALEELSAQYADGADPLAVLRDLAELTHWVIGGQDHARGRRRPDRCGPDERARGQAMAFALRVAGDAAPVTCLADVAEGDRGGLRTRPIAMMAAEMAVIRLTHVAELPSPEELIRKSCRTRRPRHHARAGAGGGGGGGMHARWHRRDARHSTDAMHADRMPGRPARWRSAPCPRRRSKAMRLARYPTFEHVARTDPRRTAM